MNGVTEKTTKISEQPVWQNPNPGPPTYEEAFLNLGTASFSRQSTYVNCNWVRQCVCGRHTLTGRPGNQVPVDWLLCTSCDGKTLTTYHGETPRGKSVPQIIQRLYKIQQIAWHTFRLQHHSSHSIIVITNFVRFVCVGWRHAYPNTQIRLQFAPLLRSTRYLWKSTYLVKKCPCSYATKGSLQLSQNPAAALYTEQTEPCRPQSCLISLRPHFSPYCPSNRGGPIKWGIC